MASLSCPGLPASWINGWMAAVGATVLDPRIRLCWTKATSPLAVLSCDGLDPADVLSASWPSTEALNDLPIARDWGGSLMERKVSVEIFAKRARHARGHPQSWSLSSTLTDLHVDKSGEVAHAPFDPAGPGTIKWMHHRLRKVHGHVEPSAERLKRSFSGDAVRVKDNGLGFDQTRLGSQSDSTSIWIDPVVEVLAFFGLAIFPVRGGGIDDRLGGAARAKEIQIQRGWRRIEGERDARFSWPAWRQPLDSFGIDALLDVWQPHPKCAWRRAGVHAAWKIVPYKPRASADPTRAFGSERL